MSLGKPVIRPNSVFMDDEMRDFAISEAQKALDTSNSEKVSVCSLTFCTVGCIIHEIDIRKAIQVYLALYSWKELRWVRHARSRPLHLLLHRTEGLPHLVNTQLNKSSTHEEQM